VRDDRPEGGPSLAPGYVNSLLAAVRGVLKACWRLELLTSDQYHRAVDLKPVRGSTLPAGRSLSAGEIQALVAACQADPSPAGPRDAVILGLGFAAGLRRAEIVALDLADHDAESGAIEVRSGKGRKARRTFAPAGLQAALADWLAARGQEPGPLLCPVDKGGTLFLRRCRSQVVYAVAAKRAGQAGVAPFSPHDMRRTFIGDLLDSGADISLAQQLAGHASVSTTQGYYRPPERARRTAAQALHFPWQSRR
jgi:integrase